MLSKDIIEKPIEIIKNPLPKDILVNIARKTAVKLVLRDTGMTLTAVNKLVLTNESEVRKEILKRHGVTEQEYQSAGGTL